MLGSLFTGQVGDLPHGPRRAGIDPGAERVYFGGLQTGARGRHDDVLVETGYVLDEQALRARAGDDGRDARAAAFYGIGAMIQTQAVHLQLGAVTGPAA